LKTPPYFQHPVVFEILAAGTTLIRIHRDHLGPFWYGNGVPEWRFDSPNGKFGTMYAGLDHTASIVETVLKGPPGQIITRDTLYTRAWTELRLTRSIRVAALWGAGLTKNGVSSGLVHHDDYDVTMQIANEVFEAAPDAHGIQYTSTRNDTHRNVAIFDRAGPDFFEIVQTVRFEDWPKNNWLPIIEEHGAIFGGSSAVPGEIEEEDAEADIGTPPADAS
jgi:hypothetical protein